MYVVMSTEAWNISLWKFQKMNFGILDDVFSKKAISINPFHVTSLFPYPLKTLENL